VAANVIRLRACGAVQSRGSAGTDQSLEHRT